jgi:hypothetical protein
MELELVFVDAPGGRKSHYSHPGCLSIFERAISPSPGERPL